jgi:ATP-dependent Clp protease ATP-binding subunit ClpA
MVVAAASPHDAWQQRILRLGILGCRDVRVEIEWLDRAKVPDALTQPEIERIVDLMLNDLRARLSECQMTLEITAEARRFIAQQGFDPIYGARPLRRFISREVETRIGRALLAGDVLDGAVIRIGYADGELAVSYENQE